MSPACVARSRGPWVWILRCPTADLASVTCQASRSEAEGQRSPEAKSADKLSKHKIKKMKEQTAKELRAVFKARKRAAKVSAPHRVVHLLLPTTSVCYCSLCPPPAGHRFLPPTAPSNRALPTPHHDSSPRGGRNRCGLRHASPPPSWCSGYGRSR